MNPNKCIIRQAYYSLNACKAHSNMLFIYGDNQLRVGTKGQACIRPLPNAFGIITKKKPSYEEDAFFYDSDLTLFSKLIDADLNRLDILQKEYEFVVLPSDGLGTGLARLPTKAPQCFAYLAQRLKDMTGLTMTPNGIYQV
jgi:hypothetical protein